ncbi:MAG: hypothetical protein KAU95_02095 [Candidatus Aenigmarchaeota archaeon]|nr:hypothetical protein [Candidatus Aenigmarchaeota archaeon]
MTTIAALEYEDMCVIVGDRKASMGNLHAENVTKVRRIGKDRDVVLGGAGVAGHLMRAGDILDTECKLYEQRKGMPIKAKTASAVLSNIILGSEAMFILVGKNGEKENPGVYSLDAAGLNVEDLTGMASVGSGSPTALGILRTDMADLKLETNYGKDRKIELGDLAKICTRAVYGATETDIYSGGSGIDMYTITKEEGLKEYHIERPGSEGMLADVYNLFGKEDKSLSEGDAVLSEYEKKGEIK